MGERIDCSKMAAMCGCWTPLAGNADETSSLQKTATELVIFCCTFSRLSVLVLKQKNQKTSVFFGFSDLVLKWKNERTKGTRIPVTPLS